MLGLLFQIGIGTGSSTWNAIISELGNLGVFVFVLPFLLALAVFYGVLMFAFKDKMPKSAIGIISLVMAFFVMLYTSYNVMIAGFFAALGGSALIVGSGILVAVIFLGLIGFNVEKLTAGDKSKWLFILGIIAIAVLIFFGAGAQWFVPIGNVTVSQQFQVAVFFIIILALAIWWLGGGKEEQPPAQGAQQ